MSVHVHGHMVISDFLPCKIGKYNNDSGWRGYICGESTASLLGKLLGGAREHWADENYNPLLNDLRIIWETVNPQNEDGECYTYDSEEEYYSLTTEQCNALRFPSGFDGPITLTIAPYYDRYDTYWHIVFYGSLRRRYQDGMEQVETWWKTLQQFFNFSAGYIHAEWLDHIWEDKIFH